MPNIEGASHVAFTVRDMEASANWYQRVLGWRVLRRYTGDQAGTPRVLLVDPSTSFVVGLCQPEDGSSDAFDHRRTGLDHFAFKVADESELDRWMTHLDELGVAHSPVRVLDSDGSCRSRILTASSSSYGCSRRSVITAVALGKRYAFGCASGGRR